MADIDTKEELDRLDLITICLYRLGMVLAAISLLLFALQQWFYPAYYQHILSLFAFSMLLQAAHLHIYNKAIRYLLTTATWLGVWCVSLSSLFLMEWLADLSLGLLFITLAGICYKESFCFSLSVLRLAIITLILTWLAISFSQVYLAAIAACSSSALLAYMAYKKCKMPFHYDLGDRSKYQV